MRQQYTNGELGIQHGLVQTVVRSLIMLGLEGVTDLTKGFLAKTFWGLDLARYSANKMSVVFVLIVIFDTGCAVWAVATGMSAIPIFFPVLVGNNGTNASVT